MKFPVLSKIGNGDPFGILNSESNISSKQGCFMHSKAVGRLDGLYWNIELRRSNKSGGVCRGKYSCKDVVRAKVKLMSAEC